MNDIFKLKIDIGSVHIELEGASNCVHAIFSEIRAQGLGKLSIPNYINDNDDNLEIKKEEKELLKDVQLTENKRKSITSENTSELPNINEIVIKDIPQTECEWIIIYALYCSENVTKTFTMEDIRQMYRNTNRYTDSRNKNFATNFKKCVNDNYFSCINDKDFTLAEDGKIMALNILNRSTEQKNIKKKRKNGQTLTKATYNLVELDLNQKQREELKRYVGSFSKVSYSEKALIIANWLKINAQIDEVNEHIIFSALRIVGDSASFDIKGALRNGRSRNNYFIVENNRGFYKVHHIGEDHIKEMEQKRV